MIVLQCRSLQVAQLQLWLVALVCAPTACYKLTLWACLFFNLQENSSGMVRDGGVGLVLA